MELKRNVQLHRDEATITLPVSKTDPFRQGCDVFLFSNQTPLNPVQALRFLMDQSPNASPTAPLIQDYRGSGVPKRRIVAFIQQQMLGMAGVMDKDVAGHSLRIGGACTLARLGFPDHHIRLLGRWTSDAYKTYIRTSKESRREAASLWAKTLDSLRSRLEIPDSRIQFWKWGHR
jgi:hypothetical protein